MASELEEKIDKSINDLKIVAAALDAILVDLDLLYNAIMHEEPKDELVIRVTDIQRRLHAVT